MPMVVLVVALILGAAFLAAVPLLFGGAALVDGSHRVPIYIARPVSDVAPVSAASLATGFAAVVKPVLPAVVNISTSRIVKTQVSPFFNDPFFRQFFGGDFGREFQIPREQREGALGSGVIISPEGYILTNNHVIEGATDIKVFLPDKREFKGKVIGRDPKTDIAVVKIDATGLPAVTLGDSSKLQVGDYVLAIGDPFGVGETVTNGIVSATGRGGLDLESYEDFIQTDAPINPGNSGGALIDVRGDLVGINTAILSANGGGNQGIGFAVPVNLARNVMDQILQHGTVVRGWLGVTAQELTPALAKSFGLLQDEGALVGDVDHDGPAARAGIKRGDVIVGLNSQPVTGPNALRIAIAETMPETVVQLKVIRNGQSRDIPVKLGELAENGVQKAAALTSGSGPMAGVAVEPLTPEIEQDLKLPSGETGVVVDSVQPNSPASDAELRHGDVIEQVNGTPVSSVSDYEKAVQQAGQQEVVLLISRGGSTAFVVVQATQ
jgi:serine protease Do